MKPDVLLVAPIYAPTRERARIGLHGPSAVGGERPRRDARARWRIGSKSSSRAAVPALARSLIERLPRLRLIACFGVGVDAIDLAAARERGIAVTNTPMC